MGLFKKRATDQAEIERLEAEIAAMGARLNASEAAKNELDSTVRGLAARLDTSTPPPPSPPPPAPPARVSPDESHIERLDAEIERLSSRLADGPEADIDPARVDDLADRVEQLTARVDETATPAVDPTRLDHVAEQVQRIGDRIDALDGRITSISTELANQITELSGDIDGDERRAPADAVVDELRDAQTRLASEQARYQIAFRQDLAELVDRLRRS